MNITSLLSKGGLEMTRILTALSLCIFLLGTGTAQSAPTTPSQELVNINSALHDGPYDIVHKNSYVFSMDVKQLVIDHASERATKVNGTIVGGYTFTGKYSVNPVDIEPDQLKYEEDEEFPGTYIIRIQCKKAQCISYQRHEVRFDANRKAIEDRNINFKHSFLQLILNNADKAKKAEENLRKLLIKAAAKKM